MNCFAKLLAGLIQLYAKKEKPSFTIYLSKKKKTDVSYLLWMYCAYELVGRFVC
jgi:hypothetical protein